jgi:hypothetical protein
MRFAFLCSRTRFRFLSTGCRSSTELALQMGHKLTDPGTTDRYTKFDKRYLATAMTTIDLYVRDLNRLTKCDLLQPDTLKILPTRVSATMLKKPENPFERNGGRDKDRTCDPYDVNVVLSR